MEIYIVHALDDSTKFLNVFESFFKDNYYVLSSSKESLDLILEGISTLSDNALVVFLGHGFYGGLHVIDDEGHNNIFISKTNCNEVFNNKRVLLLSCDSNQFIEKIEQANEAIGFGYILSSIEEKQVRIDNYNEYYGEIAEVDINQFNNIYCNSVIESIKLYLNNSIEFGKIPIYIEFYINKAIMETLEQKDNPVRKDLTRLLFMFRDEMRYLKNK
ncbi:hypothetical protein HMPREF9713_03443 [Myroides odoratimimus CCUG 12700]|uniref:hypothetical protein n=1 Tax=Myroides odoratimimus TaxID=76832 RepID=UPI0003537D0B|nr:hypothetical protein [Myroides odoratimimus]EPH06895.1 hypothetical protein HMPREF9713_03443 [Myroides odoratimimus CCUG 12700]